MLSEQEISEIASDLASLEKALADRGMNPARVTAVLAGAAGPVVENVTGQLRYAEPPGRARFSDVPLG